MKSNLKAIGYVSKEWKSEFQGILFIKDKKSTFTEHWAKLKGNLLILLKTPERTCDEMFGIVIMEYFNLEYNEEPNFQISFKMNFESNDLPIIFGFKTQDDHDIWRNHFLEAKSKGFTNKLQLLKEQVESEVNDSQLFSKISEQLSESLIEENVNKGDQSGVHVSLSCQDLPHYSFDTEPNPSINVFIYDSSTDVTQPHATTEIIYNSSNPHFNKVIFIHEEYYDPKFFVKFVVYDVRDPLTNMKHKIASADFCISMLLNNSNLMTKLKNNTDESCQSGILRLSIEEQKSQASLMESRPEVRMYHNVAENNLIRSYTFTNEIGGELKVIEMMGESIFGFPVALGYLKKLLEEESLIQECLLRFATSDNTLENLRTDLQISIRDKRARYEMLFGEMSQMSAEGRKFHPSNLKSEFEYSFIPINLHVNRIYLNNEVNNEMVKYLDVVTVGAFAAHCLKFKDNCGLASLVRQIPESVGMLQSNSSLMIADSMLRSYVRLIQDIINQLRHLCSYITYPSDVSQDLDQLDVKVRKYLKFFHHSFFISMSLEQIRRDHQQLIYKVKEFEKNKSKSESSIKVIKECSNKFEKSIDDVGQLTINILWSKILNSLNSSQLIGRWNEFVFREHVVYSQAISAIVTGISLALSTWNTEIWSQMIICGVPMYFEGFLSSYGDEIGMLDDMRWIINKMSQLKIFLKPANENTKAPGFNFVNLKSIEIYCMESCWKFAPIEVKMKGRVQLHLHPYFFNVGINELQTFSDRMSKNDIITQINNTGYQSLRNYYEMLVRNIGNPKRTCKEAEIIDRLNDLRYELDRNRNKPIEIMEIVQEISWCWNAVRFTSCKSAKDRTSMGLTLEQTRWLKNMCNLKSETFNNTLDCIRMSGLRRENCLKNTGCSKYAFNRVQLLSFPKLYKPPAGSYGGGES